MRMKVKMQVNGIVVMRDMDKKNDMKQVANTEKTRKKIPVEVRPVTKMMEERME